MSLQPARRLITAQEFQLMAERGILTEKDRVELVNGEILHMSPIGSRHAACVNRISNLLMQQLQTTVIVSVQNPVNINRLSSPEPDIALLKPVDHYYAHHHPGPSDVLLLIEVAETSLAYDREVKIPLYASADILECWLVDLEQKQIEVYRKPADGSYQIKEQLQLSDQLYLSLSDHSFEVQDLIGNI